MIAWLLVAAGWAASLDLDQVLAAADSRVPSLAVAEADLRQAEAKLLASQGAFDPRLVGSTKQTTGKDPRSSTDGALVVTTPLGPSVEAGWRRGLGDFPSYDDGETTDAGEVRLGLDVPLLAGLGTNADRAARLDAQWGVDRRDALVDDQRIRVLQHAEAAWWSWVAAGAGLEVARRQQELAEARDRAIRIEVTEGARSRLEQLDNERVLFERQADRVAAEQKLQTAALWLSLWFRDADGTPVIVDPGALPEMSVAEPTQRDVDADVQRALDRPDVRAARVGVQQSQVGVSLARNTLLPTLDGAVQARQDLTDEPTEWKVGVSLEVPLALREGRGTLRAAKAGEARAAQHARGLEDRVRASVLSLHAARDAAAERIGWTQASAERAEEVLSLERRGWELGASQLFVLLQRESRLAKARKEAIDAQLAYALADLDLRAAVGDPAAGS